MNFRTSLAVFMETLSFLATDNAFDRAASRSGSPLWIDAVESG
jgi:hypothetical protein